MSNINQLVLESDMWNKIKLGGAGVLGSIGDNLSRQFTGNSFGNMAADAVKNSINNYLYPAVQQHSQLADPSLMQQAVAQANPIANNIHPGILQHLMQNAPDIFHNAAQQLPYLQQLHQYIG